jgi:hypothetical protein
MSASTALRRIKRLALVSLGLLFLGVGILGYILPGLPGTIFLIVAAALFVRSSDRLYNFVVRNRLFGRQVKSFLETGAMPRKAKVMSLLSMWVFSLASVVFAPYGWVFDGAILLLAVVGTLYILSRPTAGRVRARGKSGRSTDVA